MTAAQVSALAGRVHTPGQALHPLREHMLNNTGLRNHRVFGSIRPQMPQRPRCIAPASRAPVLENTAAVAVVDPAWKPRPVPIALPRNQMPPAAIDPSANVLQPGLRKPVPAGR